MASPTDLVRPRADSELTAAQKQGRARYRGSVGTDGARTRSVSVPLDAGGIGDSGDVMKRFRDSAPQETGPTEDDYAKAGTPEVSGMDAYLAANLTDPRQMGGRHAKPGMLYTGGRFKGMTRGAAAKILQGEFSGMDDAGKAGWERRASGVDSLSKGELSRREAAQAARNRIESGKSLPGLNPATPSAPAPVSTPSVTTGKPGPGTPPAASQPGSTGPAPMVPAPAKPAIQAPVPQSQRAPWNRGMINGMPTELALDRDKRSKFMQGAAKQFMARQSAPSIASRQN